MDKIKVGEWIRTNSGIVDRIKDIIKVQSGRKLIAFEKMNTYKSDLGLEKWLKTHSKNKIDIVEVGDYVNGEKVTSIDLTYFSGNDRLREPKRIGVVVGNNSMFKFSYHIKKEDIKDIVTHEQFESRKYIFEEEE